jgi:phage tail-like protein
MIQNVGRRTVMKAMGVAGTIGLVSGSARAEQEDVYRASTTPDRHGPLKTGKFFVEIDDVEVAGWKTVTIPGISVEQESYREGNEAPQEKKVAGQPSYGDLVMERGFAPDDTLLWDWVDDVRQGKVESTRRKIAVIVQDTEGNAQTRWEFTECWPKNYDPPELDASEDGEVAIESITVTFDRMIRSE